MQTLTHLNGRVHHLIFPTRKQMAETMMRFSAHYEGPPGFANSVFTRDQFETWYCDKFGRHYSEDWGGHNLPYTVVEAFFDKRFDPLTDGERTVLEALRPAWQSGEPFYVIATHQHSKEKTVRHELAHALYFLDPVYQRLVDTLIQRATTGSLPAALDAERLREWMLSIGYDTAVLPDEVQATLVGGGDRLEKRWPSLNNAVGDAVRRAFDQHMKSGEQEQ